MNMNDYKKESKITLYAFGISFLFSFGLGLIVGNPFIIAFVRAFIAAFLFGAVFFITLYIIKKYIPQFLDINTADRGEEISDSKTISEQPESKDTGDVGTKVNYVVGEKNDVEKYGSEEDADTAFHDQFTKEGELTKDAGAKTGNKTEEDEIKPGGEEFSPETDDVNKTGVDEKEEEELPPIEELLNEEEDVVPDIRTEDEELGRVKAANSDYISIGNIKIPNEPEMLAKAIKKVLKEDE